MQLPPKPFHLLGPGERIAHLEDIVRELYRCHVDLSQVRIQLMWMYGQAYKAAQSEHVSGRVNEAEIACAPIKEEEYELLGRIDALSAMRDYLASFIARE